MRKMASEVLRRLDELERRIAQLESRPNVTINNHIPAPIVQMQPVGPAPSLMPAHWPTTICDSGVTSMVGAPPSVSLSNTH